jgi:hypothetical protein
VLVTVTATKREGATETVTKREYAIWRNTGNVYRVGDDGAVEDDPWITVTPLRERLPF